MEFSLDQGGLGQGAGKLGQQALLTYYAEREPPGRSLLLLPALVISLLLASVQDIPTHPQPSSAPSFLDPAHQLLPQSPPLMPSPQPAPLRLEVPPVTYKVPIQGH